MKGETVWVYLGHNRYDSDASFPAVFSTRQEAMAYADKDVSTDLVGRPRDAVNDEWTITNNQMHYYREVAIGCPFAQWVYAYIVDEGRPD